jgi:hypothetical protein
MILSAVVYTSETWSPTPREEHETKRVRKQGAEEDICAKDSEYDEVEYGRGGFMICTPRQALLGTLVPMNACRRNTGIVPLILNLGSR